MARGAELSPVLTLPAAFAGCLRPHDMSDAHADGRTAHPSGPQGPLQGRTVVGAAYVRRPVKGADAGEKRSGRNLKS